MAFSVAEGLTHFGAWHGDSSRYVDIVKVFIGTANAQERTVIGWHGILRPIVPFLASPLAYFLDPRTSIAVVNLIFYVFGTYMTYVFTKRLFTDEWIGLIAGVGYASAPSNLLFGPAILSDGAGYAMLIVSLYIAMFILEKNPTTRNAVRTGLVVGVGLLTKEVLVAVPLVLAFRFLHDRTKRGALNLMLVCVVGALIPLAWSFLIGKGYLTWYNEGVIYADGSYNGILRNLKAFAVTLEWSYVVLLPFAFLGFFHLKNEDMTLLCETFAAVMLVLIVWPTLPEYRFTFLTFPAVLASAAVGVNYAATNLAQRPILSRLSKPQWIILILAVAVLFTNYFFRNWIILACEA